MKRILVTGGAGFIGSHFVRHLLQVRPDMEIVNVDLLTYAGNLENLSDLKSNPRHIFKKADITDKEAMRNLAQGCDGIINFAAESHVDRSILGPEVFVHTNVKGTQCLLEVARELKIRRYLQVSTDEVYGSLDEGRFTEQSPIEPNSPYAASKAAADLLCRAYVHTFGMDIVITRCSNNYGPYQFPEKLIPLMIANTLENKSLPVYGDGLNVRDWIYVEDHCAGILAAFEKGKAGEVYNISAHEEWANIDLVKALLKNLNKPESLITFVKDRPGHDRRYALDSTKIRSELGWAPKTDFNQGLKLTIGWYLENAPWLSHVRSGEYMRYYETQYQGRL